MADLTALYDCRDDFTYETKGAGKDEIKGVCLNLLVSSAPDWLPSILPVEAVGGGFTSRCFFIVEEGMGKIVPDPNVGMPDKDKKQDLIYDIEKIHSLVGEYKFSSKAHAFYIDWYEKERESIKQNTSLIKDPKLAGYESRKATHLKKLAMVFTASKNSKLIIEEAEIKEALATMLHAEKAMPNAFRSIGRSQHAAVLEQVLGILRREGEIGKAELMRMVQRDLDFSDFAQIEMALEAMAYITRIIRPGKPTLFRYRG